MISIVIPVRNGGEDLRRLLDSIAAQEVDAEVEVIVIDSSSTDGSAELARSHGATVRVIPVEQFDHGATRNLGVSLSAGDPVVFTSQDAYAEDEHWLARLTDLGEHAGVYGRQLPHHDATPPERYFLDFVYGPEPRVQRAASTAELSMATTLFSNANSAIRRRHLLEMPFAEDIVMSEDQEWSRRALLAGYTLRYEPRAAVRHSHPYSLRSAFRRFFDSGASSERAYMAGGRKAGAVLRRESLAYGRGELQWLWRGGMRAWIPYAILYEGTKYAGLQFGKRHRMLPRSVKRRMSALPSHWG